MKFPKFLLAMTIASSSVFVSAQPPDENVADLFNRQDWLTLEKIFPEIKDSIRDPCLRYMTQSLLDCSFNRPRQALGALDTLMGPLLVNMSFSNIPSMVLFRCEAMRLNKKYAAADYLDSFLRYLSATMDISRFPEHLQMSRILNGLRDARLRRSFVPNATYGCRWRFGPSSSKAVPKEPTCPFRSQSTAKLTRSRSTQEPGRRQFRNAWPTNSDCERSAIRSESTE